METEIANQVVGLGGANDFSLWQLFLRADFVVKAVILLLIASSIFSWALIYDKVRLFRRIDQSLTRILYSFALAKTTLSKVFITDYRRETNFWVKRRLPQF